MATRRFFLFILCVGVLTKINVAWSDGKVFIWRNKDADIYQPTQKAYIRWDGAEEKLLLQTKYEGPAEKMVWVVPVPSEPKVEKGDPNVFETLSKRTQDRDFSYTYFRQRYSGGSGGAPPPGTVKWRRRIGDYDVVLLSPVGGEHVIQWLNSNQFGVPDEAIPILEQYIAEKWWMVAAKIHRDALTDVTREKLATGTLDPLEYTFKSPKCIYPLRLTSLTAGPVEELIYIEGPTHYEPVTVRGNWDIEVFGGPDHWVPNPGYMSDMECVIKLKEGRTKTTVREYLTKLRKVFQPQEMTDDIVFERLDYAQLHEKGTALAIGQAATQYGRHRDPAGVPLLLESLTPDRLQQVRPRKEDYKELEHISRRILSPEARGRSKYRCAHLRSCIWALGEISLEHGADNAIEEVLLRCARHEIQVIRMEAYVALTKIGSKKLKSILIDQLERDLGDGSPYIELPWWYYGDTEAAELDFAADWVEHLGTAVEREKLVDILSKAISVLPTDGRDSFWSVGWNKSERIPGGLVGWVMERAALTQDTRLLPALRAFRERIRPDPILSRYFLRVEAACGSQEAIAMAARLRVEHQNKIEVRVTDGRTYPRPGTRPIYLRSWILERTGPHRKFYRMPQEVDQTIARAALAEKGLNDWFVLYLLAQIVQPQDLDRKRIRMIWDKEEELKRVVAVDVLWVWKDVKTLRELHDQCAEGDAKTEIQRALDSLGDA